MTDEEFKDYLVTHVNRLENYVNTLKEAVSQYNSGVPYDESFKDIFEAHIELYEEKADIKDARNEVIRLMEHLLKIRFVTNTRNLPSWFKRSVAFPRKEIISDIDLRISRKKYKEKYEYEYDENIFRETSENFDKLYENAVANYEDAADDYDDLKFGEKHLPEECPWTLMDLVTKYYDELLRMIPLVDDEDYYFLEEKIELVMELAEGFG